MMIKIDKKDFGEQRIFLDEDYRWNFLMKIKDNKQFNVYKDDIPKK